MVYGRKRILMVSENGLYPELLGGMEIRARELVTCLQDTYDIALLTKENLKSPDGRAIPLRIPRADTIARPWPGVPPVRFVRSLPLIEAGRKRLKQNLSALQPDLVYFLRFCSLHPVMVHDLLHSARSAVARFGDQHAAVFASFAASWARRVALRVSPLAARARARVTLVFNCRFLHHFYAPLFQGYSNQVVIYDGVDARLFHPAAAPPSAARFAFLGRADWDKGFLDFCRAMASLPRSLIDGIEIIAEGPQLREGLEILRVSGRSDLVRQAGPSHHESVPHRLRTASVLVHPSRDEGMPAAVLEAMACGLAVVATTAGGIPEVVRHGETGLCAAPGDVVGLMAACRLLAENADLRRRLGANARALVASHYDASTSRAATRHLIEETIDRAGRVDQSLEAVGSAPGSLDAD